MAMYQPPPSGAHKHYAKDVTPRGLRRPLDGLPPDRANRRTAVLAAPWALLAWMVIAVVFVILDVTSSTASALGRALVPALAAYVVAVAWARASGRAWAWWRYPAVVVPVAAVLGGLLAL